MNKATLQVALNQLHGTGGHLLKIWFALKYMGMALGSPPVLVDTSNSTPALRRLFDYGAADGGFYIPFAHTARYMTMKHDAARSIVQTTIQRWCTSGSVVTCDPTDFLEIRKSDSGGLSVTPARRYPLGLGYGESGFAVKDQTSLRIPLSAFAVWYGRQTDIPDDCESPLEFLEKAMLAELNICPQECAVIFERKQLTVLTSKEQLANRDIVELCSPFIEGLVQLAPILSYETYEKHARRVRGMVSNIDLPAWMRTPPEADVKNLLSQSCNAILLFGPPRTGKTRIIESLIPRSDPTRCTIQIHDGWGYDQLIEGFSPDSEGKWQWKDGPLKVAVESGKKYIVLEEINRTQISQSMGEVFSLIEDSYRGVENALTLRSGKSFWIPNDCVFLMTMNTVDKSTEEIDDALMGRVAAVECPPRPEDLQQMLVERNCEQGTREKIADLYGSILDMYPLGHGYFAGLPKSPGATAIVQYYKARVRPVLLNHLGALRRSDISKLDNLVESHFQLP